MLSLPVLLLAPMSDPDPAASNHAMRGMAYCAGALLLFACMDAATKYLTSRYSIPLIIWIRYGVHWLCMSLLLLPRERGQLLAARQPGLVVLRSIILVAVTLLVSLALQRMPVAEVTAVQFLAPIMVTLLAGPLLKEKTGKLRTVCAVAGFLGVLLVAHPGSGLDPLGLLFALLAAVFGAMYQLLSRLLGASERTPVMIYYVALVGFACFSFGTPWFWSAPWPGVLDFLLVAVLGLAGWLGHSLFTLAYRDAQASLLAPVTYLQLFWAGILGWMLFGHIPTGMTLLGMLIIAASGVAVALQDSLRHSA